MFTIIPRSSGMSMGLGLFFASAVFLRLSAGELGPQIYPNFALWEMPTYIHSAATRCV